MTNKLKFVIIVLGAVLGSIAPFVHMVFPKNNPDMIFLEQKLDKGTISQEQFEQDKKRIKIQYFHFGSLREFLAGIGKPLAMFCFSLIMLMALPHIHQYQIQKAILIASLLLFLISTYFLIWCFYPRNDLPKSVYYISIAIGSLISTFIIYFLIIYQKRIGTYLSKIWDLTDFILIDVREQFIRKEEEASYLKEIKKKLDI